MTFKIQYKKNLSMNSKRMYLLIIASILFCGTTMFSATPNDSIKSQTPAVVLPLGKTLYENSCVRCHKLKEPGNYTQEQWPGIMDKMQKRSRITDEEKATILTYLLSEAKKDVKTIE